MFESQEPPPTSQTRTALPSVAQECSRTDVSDRSAAILKNAASKDEEITAKDNYSNGVYCKEIRREKNKTTQLLGKKNEWQHSSSECDFFLNVGK